MKKSFNWIFWVIFSPILSIIIWFFGTHSWSHFVDTLFIVSMILFIAGFILILVQDGIFDATSYGFRRIRYQMSSTKHKKSWEDDEFMNPKQAKRDFYIVEKWAKLMCIINFIYVIICLLAIFTF